MKMAAFTHCQEWVKLQTLNLADTFTHFTGCIQTILGKVAVGVFRDFRRAHRVV